MFGQGKWGSANDAASRWLGNVDEFRPGLIGPRDVCILRPVHDDPPDAQPRERLSPVMIQPLVISNAFEFHDLCGVVRMHFIPQPHDFLEGVVGDKLHR